VGRNFNALAEKVAFRMACHIMAAFDQTRSEADRTRSLAVHLRGLRDVLGEKLFRVALDQVEPGPTIERHGTNTPSPIRADEGTLGVNQHRSMTRDQHPIAPHMGG
jgi:hypothetical protein